jgi:uncharacterized membrane protein
MQSLASLGRTLYGLAILAFGMLHVGYGDFVTRVVPWWPAAISGRSRWAYFLGTALIVAGAYLLADRRTVTVAMWLASGLLLSFVCLGMPLVAGDSILGGAWTVAGKALVLCGGALLVAQASAGPDVHSRESSWSSARVRRIQSLGPWFLAAFLVQSGVQHFLYIDFVASLVPAWIPGARFWSYFAGVALIAGGLGMLVPAIRRLAALLSGAMIFSWVFLVHLPRAVRTFPAATNETTALFEALAMSGVAWLVAAASWQHQTTTASELPARSALDVGVPVGEEP